MEPFPFDGLVATYTPDSTMMCTPIHFTYAASDGGTFTSNGSKSISSMATTQTATISSTRSIIATLSQTQTKPTKMKTA